MRSRFPAFVPALAAAIALACASSALAQTWTSVGPPGGLDVHAVLGDPSVPATVYAGTNHGVYVSTDSGGSWGAASSGLSSQFVTSLAAYQPPTPPGVPPAPPFLYAGTADTGVFVSQSRGQSWVPAGTLPNVDVTALTVDAASGTVWAATQGGVFKSTNNGSSWTPMNNGLTNTIIASLAIDPSNPSILFAGVLGAIYRTTNGGGIWAPVFTSATDRIGAIAVDPTASSTVYAGTVFGGQVPPGTNPTGSLIKSTNGGTVWAPAVNGLPSVGVKAIGIDRTATARIYLGTAGGGAFVTKNFGASWTAQNDGLLDHNVESLTITATSPSTVYAGSQASGVFRAVADAVGVCLPSSTALCLQNARFKIEVAWSVPAQGRSGVGQAIPLSSDTGTFWFFDSANYELMIKVLDGRPVNGHIWVFYGALSNVAYAITVTDTQTGAIRNYANPDGTLASVADVLAF